MANGNIRKYLKKKKKKKKATNEKEERRFEDLKVRNEGSGQLKGRWGEGGREDGKKHCKDECFLMLFFFKKSNRMKK